MSAPFEVVGAASYDGDSDTLTPVFTLDSRVSLTVFGRPFEGIVNLFRADGVVADVYVPALNNTVAVNIDKLTLIEPTPMPDIDPLDALVTIIAKATSGLIALRDEHEKNLRDSVLEIRDISATLADLVERW